MPKRNDSRDIDRAASIWAAKLDRGQLTADDKKILDGWLNGDPRHRGALLRAQAISMMSESAAALGPDFDPAPFAPPRQKYISGLSRRKFIGWTGGIAVTSLATLAVTLPAAGAEIRTKRGEIRLVPLQDGSSVMLNTNSCVRVQYDNSTRHVTLVEGEAFFSVTKEKRPFIVDAGARQFIAAQAEFRVRKLHNSPISILVHNGMVSLPDTEQVGQKHDLRLTTNMQVELASSGLFAQPVRPELMTPDEIARDLAWRQGKLSFEGETLAQAANSFARYSDRQIIIRDPMLAQEPVTGLFAANDPAGFANAVSAIFHATVTQRGGDIILKRSASL